MDAIRAMPSVCGSIQNVVQKLRKQHPTIIQSYTYTTTRNLKISTNQTDNTAANEDTLNDNEEPHDQNDNDDTADDTPIENATNQVTSTNHQEPLINEQANDDAHILVKQFASVQEYNNITLATDLLQHNQHIYVLSQFQHISVVLEAEKLYENMLNINGN